MTQDSREAAAEASTDGRVRRGERSREAIVDAMMELIREGELAPTAEQVARRAGVGTRTVFRHFDDMESLHGELSARVAAEMQQLLEGEPEPSGGVQERVRGLAQRRATAFERITPFKRSANLHRWGRPYLERDHVNFVRVLRACTVEALPELETAPETAREAVDLLTSFAAWDRLRADQRLGRERAQAVMEQSVLAVLATLG